MRSGTFHSDSIRRMNTMEDKDLIKAVEDATLDNMFPLLKSALSFGDAAKETQSKRFIQDVVVEINTKLWRLEQRVDKEYMKTEDFVNFLHKTLLKVALDLRQEKMMLFANIIVNSTLIGNANPEDGRKYLFDETIDKIDERLFEFLLRASSRGLDGLGLEDKGWRGTDDELKLLGVDDRTFQFNAEYLLSVGVMVRLPKFELKGETGHLMYHEEYFVTQYGREFVEYVREQ